MRIRTLLSIALAVAFLTSCHPPVKKNESPAGQPNILLIVADDLGYSDIGSYGGNIHTPVLDQLAKESLRFSNFHVLPTCSPTRSCLLTGNDNHVAGLGIMSELDYPVLRNKQLPGYAGHLSHQVVTISEVLQGSGYHTYMVGKWHLGEEPGQNPFDRGFEESFSLSTGGGSHWNDMRPLAPPQSMVYTSNGKVVNLPDDFYSSKNYTDSLISFIGRHRSDGMPFFAYLSYTAVHDPLQVPEAYIKKYKGTFDLGWDSLRAARIRSMQALGLVPEGVKSLAFPGIPSWNSLTREQQEEHARDMEVYAGMLDYMDMSIGRLFEYLKQQRLYDNTLILFLSDNGANGALATAYPGNADGKYLSTFDNSLGNRGLKNSYTEMGPGWAQASTGPYRMFKSFTSEGGIRAPLLVKMPGTTRDAGKWTPVPAYVADIMPTILALTGAKYPEQFRGSEIHPLIGISLVPLLTGDPNGIHRAGGMGIELFEMKAYLEGNWKLLRLPEPYGTGQWQLFDLATDPGETRDVSGLYPDQTKEMISDWEEYARANGLFNHNGHFDSLYRKSFKPENEDD